jgi:hypothetical protein
MPSAPFTGKYASCKALLWNVFSYSAGRTLISLAGRYSKELLKSLNKYIAKKSKKKWVKIHPNSPYFTAKMCKLKKNIVSNDNFSNEI